MTQTNESRYLPSIISLRGIAVLLVVVGHFFSAGMLGVHSAALEVAAPMAAHLGVMLFFVISGFVLSYMLYDSDYSFPQFPRFLLRRMIRLEPPYLISFAFILLMGAIKILRGGVFNYEGGLTGIAAHIFYLNGIIGKPWLNLVFWSLAIEFQFYLFIGIVFPFIKKLTGVQLALVLIGICSIKLLYSNNVWLLFYLSFFVTGIALCAYYKQRLSLLHSMSVVSIAVLINCWHNEGHMFYDVLVFAGFAMVVISRININSKALIFAGTISYSLYLVHANIGSRLLLWLDGADVTNVYLRILAAVLGFALSVGVSYIFYRLVERPFHGLSRSINKH